MLLCIELFSLTNESNEMRFMGQIKDELNKLEIYYAFQNEHTEKNSTEIRSVHIFRMSRERLKHQQISEPFKRETKMCHSVQMTQVENSMRKRDAWTLFTCWMDKDYTLYLSVHSRQWCCFSFRFDILYIFTSFAREREYINRVVAFWLV